MQLLMNGKTFNSTFEASKAMLEEFKLFLGKTYFYFTASNIRAINCLDYQDRKCGINQTSAWLNTNNGTCNWQIAKVDL